MHVAVEALYEYPADVWILADERELRARSLNSALRRAHHYWAQVEPAVVGLPWTLVVDNGRDRVEYESEVIWYETDHGTFPTDGVAMRDLDVNEWVLAGPGLRRVYQIMQPLTRD